MFTSSVIDTIEDSKLTFNAVETQITLEVCLNPSGASNSTLKVPISPPPVCPTLPPALDKGVEKRRRRKKKEKANAMEDTLEVAPKTLEIANIVTEGVSKSLMAHILAYLLSKSKASGRSAIIINSGATSHMVPHWSWFWTYFPLVPPQPVAFKDNSTTSAIRIRTVTLFSTISRKKYEIILTNVLLILEFWISLISINHLSTTRLSTVFPASSSTCYV
ncbi:hypothetical protein PAXRUDRAFT_18871 [Paxillus rubicundulus Ve08.2h10]|uniref:Retrovirus-related Pol polyprotein from transposon TNT 1-94-like beta-barrel domain-containing protein n=1 Tax=Paxillus rubicundulus Ve08.2h10 TaxID=930991 RepID=A0A0D0BW79_9AGAM|nr:hypothetical protein PAXRUDRAFT_18871 [Paxillus rubicundulus Ve08.2h10]